MRWKAVIKRLLKEYWVKVGGDDNEVNRVVIVAVVKIVSILLGMKRTRLKTFRRGRKKKKKTISTWIRHNKSFHHTVFISIPWNWHVGNICTNRLQSFKPSLIKAELFWEKKKRYEKCMTYWYHAIVAERVHKVSSMDDHVWVCLRLNELLMKY